jgi:hypothetical protein
VKSALLSERLMMQAALEAETTSSWAGPAASTAAPRTGPAARNGWQLPATVEAAPFELLRSCAPHGRGQRPNDVGAAFDRAWVTDLAIPNGFGRHDNDGMFSFCVASPAGFAVEVGHGARTIGEDWDDSRRHYRVSAWGHRPRRPQPTAGPPP